MILNCFSVQWSEDNCFLTPGSFFVKTEQNNAKVKRAIPHPNVGINTRKVVIRVAVVNIKLFCSYGMKVKENMFSPRYLQECYYNAMKGNPRNNP
jgi:hypothetical protein